MLGERLCCLCAGPKALLGVAALASGKDSSCFVAFSASEELADPQASEACLFQNIQWLGWCTLLP